MERRAIPPLPAHPVIRAQTSSRERGLWLLATTRRLGRKASATPRSRAGSGGSHHASASHGRPDSPKTLSSGRVTVCITIVASTCQSSHRALVETITVRLALQLSPHLWCHFLHSQAQPSRRHSQHTGTRRRQHPTASLGLRRYCRTSPTW